MELKASIKGLKSGLRLGTIRPAPTAYEKRLQEIDPTLSIHWNRIRCLWQVWRPSRQLGTEAVVHTVMMPDETYRSFDERVITEFRRSDANARGRRVIDELIEENEALEEEWERDKEREEEDFIHYELEPAIKKDLNTEVSHSHSGISIGASNRPMEDVRAAPKPRYRFGAGKPPQGVAAEAANGSTFDT